MKQLAAKDKSEGPNAQEQSRGIFADLAGLGKLWPYLKADKRLVVLAAILIPVISGIQTAMPLVLRQTIDKGIIGKDTHYLIYGSVLYFLGIVGEYAARSGQSVTTSLAVLRMIRKLRMELVTHVLELKASFHDKSMSGSLVTRATGDFDNLSDSLNMGVLTSVVDIAVLIGCVSGMFLLNWRLALTALVILPVVGVIVQWFSRALKTAMLQARIKIAALNAFTQECFYGHATIKLLTAEATAVKHYDALNIEYRDAQMSSVVLDSTMFAVLDGIASVTLGLVLWLVVSGLSQGSGGSGGSGGTASHWGDALSAGVIVAFVQYIQQLFEPLKQLGNKMAMLQGAFTSIDRIFGVLGRGEKMLGGQSLGGLEGSVVFDHVAFRYGTGDSDPLILRDVSFTLPAGETLALVGATGSGKSTIIKLLSKLYDGYTGKILIDGHDLQRLDPLALRQYMAIVPQDIVLFDGTVAFNIALGQPGITQAQIQQAAVEVGADEFIRNLPGGYDHLIREQGGNLSHGQRQLIAFARALVKNPRLVILDEATSSVDPVSEGIIQSAIQRILRGRTVIVIAHRLSTIRQCNQILVISRGEIVEGGEHAELLAKQGAYYHLYQGLEKAQADLSVGP